MSNKIVLEDFIWKRLSKKLQPGKNNFVLEDFTWKIFIHENSTWKAFCPGSFCLQRLCPGSFSLEIIFSRKILFANNLFMKIPSGNVFVQDVSAWKAFVKEALPKF